MKHIVALSGGKDSTAMLLLLLENNYPVDEIVYFDAGTWEWEQVRKHVNRLEEYIGIKIVRVYPSKPFDETLKALGFPRWGYRWCTQEKRRAINKNRKQNTLWYIGFSLDEKYRIGKQKMKNILYPLITDFELTGKECLSYCYKYGFNWEGLYKLFNRVSCWCCPFSRIAELKVLYKLFPQKWERLKRMQRISRIPFRKKCSIFDLEKRFKKEETVLKLKLLGDDWDKWNWLKLKEQFKEELRQKQK